MTFSRLAPTPYDQLPEQRVVSYRTRGGDAGIVLIGIEPGDGGDRLIYERATRSAGAWQRAVRAWLPEHAEQQPAFYLDSDGDHHFIGSAIEIMPPWFRDKEVLTA